MENNKSSGTGSGAMGGKGFYIVLLLCAAVLGISTWIFLSDAGTNVEEIEAAENGAGVPAAIVTTLPADTTISMDLPLQRSTPADALPPTQEAGDAAGEPAGAEEPEHNDVQEVFSETVVSYVWPIHGSVEVPYAVETLRYDATMADWRIHDGIDIACAMGDTVAAAAGGIVVEVSDDELFGTTVEIDHMNGVHSVYANLASEPPVSEGDVVTMGQVIGSVGGTALAETNEVPHLHFSMTLDGVRTNPMDYLPEWTAE